VGRDHWDRHSSGPRALGRHLDSALLSRSRSSVTSATKGRSSSFSTETCASASLTGEQRAEISGRAKNDSPLREQDAFCLQVVSGARNHRIRLASSSRLTSSDCHAGFHDPLAWESGGNRPGTFLGKWESDSVSPWVGTRWGSKAKE